LNKLERHVSLMHVESRAERCEKLDNASSNSFVIIVALRCFIRAVHAYPRMSNQVVQAIFAVEHATDPEDTSMGAQHLPPGEHSVLEEDHVLYETVMRRSEEFWSSFKRIDLDDKAGEQMLDAVNEVESQSSTSVSIEQRSERAVIINSGEKNNKETSRRRTISGDGMKSQIAADLTKSADNSVRDARAELSKEERLELERALKQQKIPLFVQEYVFHPLSKEKSNWDIFVSFWIVYSVYSIPLFIGFDLLVAPGTFVQILNVICDIVFFIDMGITFNTAIHKDFARDPTDLIIGRKELCSVYLKGWFIIDFLSTFPFDSVGGAFFTDGAHQTSSAALRSFKLFKTLRLARLLKLTSILMKLKKVTRLMEETLDINPAVFPLLRLIFMIFSTCHFLCCGWFFVSTVEPIPKDGWIVWHQMVDKSVWSQYYMSFYWTVATMMAVGYGDIHATSTLEMGYSILSQVAGAMVFGIIIATVNNIIVEMNPRAVIFSDRMNDLKEYMKARSLPTRLKSKIRRHYQYLWRYQSMFKEVEILCSLSRNLRHKLLMQAYGDVIQSVNILREDQEDTRFIEIVVTHARPYLALTGEVLSVVGQACHDVYLVRKGRVTGTCNLYHYIDPSVCQSMELGQSDYISSPKCMKEHPEIISITTNGGMFGHEALLCGDPCHSLDYCATSICDLLTVSKASFENLRKKCPTMHAKLRKQSSDFATIVHGEISRFSDNSTREKYIQNEKLMSVEDPEFDEVLADAKTLVKKVHGGFTAQQTSHTGFSYRDTFRSIRPASDDSTELKSIRKHKTKSDERLEFYDTLLSVGAVEGEDTALKLLDRYIIHPMLPMKMAWDLFVGILILYSVITIPVNLCFVNYSTKPSSGVDEFFTWGIDFVFFVDMLVNFRTAYFDESKTFLITVPGMIASNYLKTWFLIDFLSTVPFDKMIMAALQSSSSEFRSIKVIRGLRLVRLTKMVRLIKMGKLTESIQDVVDFSPAVFRLLALLLEVTFIAHFSACFWWMFGWINGHETAWYGDLVNRPFSEQYLAAIYWAFTTMTTVGYGDITPTNEAEYLFAALMMIIGATVFGYVVGNVSRMMGSLNVGKRKKKDHLRKVKNYMRERLVAKPLQRRITQFFENILEERTAFDEKRILSDLPEKLRTEVLLHVHRDTIPHVPIFQNQTNSFIGTMLTVLRPQHVAARDFIYHEGENGYDMYFLVRGECFSGYYLGNVLSEMKMRIYQPGSFFGEGALIEQKRRKTSVMASTECYILALARSDIEWLVSTYPHWAKSFLTGMKEQYFRSKSVKGWKGLRGKMQSTILRKKIKYNFCQQEGGISRSISTPNIPEGSSKYVVNDPQAHERRKGLLRRSLTQELNST
jgi:CRP-like cAMP-binding protein